MTEKLITHTASSRSCRWQNVSPREGAEQRGFYRSLYDPLKYHRRGSSLPGARLIILREFRRQCSVAKTSSNTHPPLGSQAVEITSERARMVRSQLSWTMSSLKFVGGNRSNTYVPLSKKGTCFLIKITFYITSKKTWRQLEYRIALISLIFENNGSRDSVLYTAAYRSWHEISMKMSH